jgi:hypothetical protein
MDIQEVQWRRGLNLSRPEYRQVVGSYERCIGPSGFIKCGQFLNKLKNC